MMINPLGFPGGSVVKNLLAHAEDARDTSSIPGLGRSSEVGSGNSLQYSCLGNPWTEEPGGYILRCCRRVRRDLVTKQQTVTTTQSF